MKQNERAVSPVIGVMLMIVVTIIIAAVVSAFAANTDLTKRAGPSVALEAKTLYNVDAGFVGATWTTTTLHDAVYHPASDGSVDCYSDYSDFCNDYYYAHQDACEAAQSCVTINPSLVSAAYTDPEYDEIVPHQVGFNGNTGSNANGLLFTDKGGDPIDLKDLEFTVRYFNLASTVYGTDTKRYCGVDYTSSRPTYADVLAAVTASGSSAQNVQITSESDYNKARTNSAGSTDCRYFIKVNETGPEDTIIRPGDQFMFLVDLQPLTNSNTADYGIWSLASLRADGDIGATIAINTEGGETEWWLSHSPSGITLAHSTFEFPKT